LSIGGAKNLNIGAGLDLKARDSHLSAEPPSPPPPIPPASPESEAPPAAERPPDPGESISELLPDRRDRVASPSFGESESPLAGSEAREGPRGQAGEEEEEEEYPVPGE